MLPVKDPSPLIQETICPHMKAGPRSSYNQLYRLYIRSMGRTWRLYNRRFKTQASSAALCVDGGDVMTLIFPFTELVIIKEFQQMYLEAVFFMFLHEAVAQSLQKQEDGPVSLGVVDGNTGPHSAKCSRVEFPEQP